MTSLETKPGPATVKPAEQNGKGEKQYSVLELLELQARARAIRSQLALEPVTKIELDDSDNEPEHKEEEKKEENEITTDPSTIVLQNSNRHHGREALKSPEDKSKVPLTRPVRLKRNFRQRQVENYESDESHSVVETELENKHPNQQYEKEQIDNSENSDITIETEKIPEKENSPEKLAEPSLPNDDDVVPIIAEPEILCISSSDSENDEKKVKTKNKVKRTYITMPVIEKEVRPPTEDELFLQQIKKKSEEQKRAERNFFKTTETNTETQNKEIPEKEADSKPPETKKQGDEKKDVEMEDGEIIDEEEIVDIPESPDPQPEVTQKYDEREIEFGNPSVQETDTSRNENKSSDSESNSGGSSSASESDNSEKAAFSETSKKFNVDDDDEDIIDLGKDEDLDFEQLEMNTNTCNDPAENEQKMTRRTRSKTKASDRESPADLGLKVFFSLTTYL